MTVDDNKNPGVVDKTWSNSGSSTGTFFLSY